MKMKNMWKRFWTLDVHNHAGFTLVELIIVIAILAILSTGAIAGYSAYVESANKTADKAMIAEIKNVLTLAYYNGDLTENVILILSADKDIENVDENSQLDLIMDDAYGSNWRSALKLKADWGEFEGSSFGGAQNGIAGLVSTVDKLTSALSSALVMVPELAGSNFTEYAASLGAASDDGQAQANAAVFYVADLTGDMSSDDISSACQAMISGLTSGSGSAQDKAAVAMDGMNDYTDSTLGSAALMYAMAMGFAEDYNQKYKDDPDKLNAETNPSKILSAATDSISEAAQNGEITNSAAAFSALAEAFQEMINENRADAVEYSQYAMSKDAAAYADALKTVSTSKNSIIDNNGALNSSGYFSTEYISSMLSSYSEGCVFIEARVENGEMAITSTIDEKE